MSEIISLNDKKREKSKIQIDEYIEKFGKHIRNKMLVNRGKILDYSNELEERISAMKVDDSFDITFINSIEDEFRVGVRCLKIADDKAIVIGGYGFDFNIHHSEYAKVEDIVKKFLTEFSVISIVSFDNLL